VKRGALLSDDGDMLNSPDYFFSSQGKSSGRQSREALDKLKNRLKIKQFLPFAYICVLAACQG
jgi:hypothetical protein